MDCVYKVMIAAAITSIAFSTSSVAEAREASGPLCFMFGGFAIIFALFDGASQILKRIQR